MLQPPQALASPPQRESALDYEIAREQATALGRLGRSLEVALAALAEFDHDKRERAEQTTSSRDARMSLVQAAGEALWCFVIQREACGLRVPRPVL